MQRVEALLNVTIDPYLGSESQNSISDNPCEWTNALYVNVVCSNTTIPHAARVTQM